MSAISEGLGLTDYQNGSKCINMTESEKKLEITDVKTQWLAARGIRLRFTGFTFFLKRFNLTNRVVALSLVI